MLVREKHDTCTCNGRHGDLDDPISKTGAYAGLGDCRMEDQFQSGLRMARCSADGADVPVHRTLVDIIAGSVGIYVLVGE